MAKAKKQATKVKKQSLGELVVVLKADTSGFEKKLDELEARVRRLKADIASVK